MQLNTTLNLEQFPQEIQDLAEMVEREELATFEDLTQNPQGLAERAKLLLINLAGEQVLPENFGTVGGILQGYENLQTLDQDLTNQTVVIGVHSFGFHRNNKGILIPNSAGKNGMRAGALIYDQVLAQNGNPVVLFTANLPKGKLMQNKSYACASKAYFVNRFKHIPAGDVLAYSYGSDAKGETEAEIEILEGFLAKGNLARLISVQQGIYIPKMAQLVKANKWPNIVPVATEAVFLKYNIQTIEDWIRIFGDKSKYIDLQLGEYEKQLLMYAIVLKIDPTGSLIKFIADTLGTFKEQLEGRQ